MGNSKIKHILYIQAAPDLAQLVQQKLQAACFAVELAASDEQGLASLDRETSYDLLLIHHRPPACDGLKIICTPFIQKKGWPVIIIVETGDEKAAVQAIELGAANYLVQDTGLGFLELLPVVIEQTLHRQQFRQGEASYRQVFEKKQAFQRYEDIINNMQLGLYIYHLENPADDGSLRLIATNPAAASFTGLAQEQVLGKRIDDCFPTLRAQGLPQILAEVIQTGQAIELEREVYHGDSRVSESWFAYRAFPLPGDCVGVLFEDITLGKQAEESLRQGERRYRLIVQDQTELICRYLPDGTLTFVNEAFCRYYGRPRQALIGQDIFSFRSETNQPQFRDSLASADPDNPVNMVDVQVVMPNGEVRWQHWSNRAIFDEHGKLAEFQSVGQDITALRHAEQEIHRQAEMLAALHETALDLAGQHALPDLLQAITRRAVKLLAAQGSHAWIYRPDSDDLELVYNYGVEPDITGAVFRRGEGLAGKVLQSGRPLIVPDYKNWIGQSPYYKEVNLEACVSVPISWGDRALGVLTVVDKLPRAFSQADVALLERFTPLAAAALEQARLLAAAQQRWRETETLRQAVSAVTQTLSLDDILDRILEGLNQVIPHERASVQLLRKGYTEVVNDRGYQKSGNMVGLKFPVPGNNINTWVIEGRRPIILDHIQETPPPSFVNQADIRVESWLGVPLIVRDKVIGMLALASEKQSYFNKEHIRLALPFANQVAVAIENARLYEQARQDAETKSVLLNEVNHRVKNNLAAIIGLLYAER
ncbi:MAG: GAF domain-containing protein, partial [Chloroflexota bacterium]